MLYLVYILLSENETSNFEKFSSGLLLGLSIGTNIIGIILIAIEMSQTNNEKEKSDN